MKRRSVIAVFIFIVLLLCIAQMTMDYLNKTHAGRKTVNAQKKTEYCIFIEVEDKMLYLLQDGSCIKQFPIASGKSELPSPLGFWKIIEKGDWGEGFGGSWLGLNVPWGI